jgi:hypothetical protein
LHDRHPWLEVDATASPPQTARSFHVWTRAAVQACDSNFVVLRIAEDQDCKRSPADLRAAIEGSKDLDRMRLSSNRNIELACLPRPTEVDPADLLSCREWRAARSSRDSDWIGLTNGRKMHIVQGRREAACDEFGDRCVELLVLSGIAGVWRERLIDELTGAQEFHRS